VYQNFTQRLMSHRALKGTEIAPQVKKESGATMDVEHTGETVKLEIAVENENVKGIYTGEREHMEIGRGIMGQPLQ